MIEKQVNPYDAIGYDHDVELYFGSNFVEVWHNFESFSFLALFSNIGGTLGLLLGISILSIVEMMDTLIDRCKRNFVMTFLNEKLRNKKELLE